MDSKNITLKFFEGIDENNISMDENTNSSYLSGIPSRNNILILHWKIFLLNYSKNLLFYATKIENQ
ncbi:MAG: hypothetical protein LBS69_07885 [Prevotellaceae bacterium]|nr:hypothetical protein [Prevotellaceae bacterium]